MIITLLIVCILLLAIILALQLLNRSKNPAVDTSAIQLMFAQTQQNLERLEKGMRDEIARTRQETADSDRQLRQELGQNLSGLSESNERKLEQLRSTVETRLETIQNTNSQKLEQFRQDSLQGSQKMQQDVSKALGEFGQNMSKTMDLTGSTLRQQLSNVTEQLARLTDSNEKKLDGLKLAMEEKLRQLQTDNTQKLEQMRQTVDEKLQGTLEKRLGESFKVVSERLEQVYKGLGEMQNLAAGVGDLKKVLTNVKSRGTWGEMQLQALLEQCLTVDQYSTNISTKANADRVEFVIHLPNRGQGEEPLLLPIDSKFPMEDYQRLLEAQEKSDAPAANLAGRQLEDRIKQCAKDIRDKYINPPVTTDFALLFLPTEGLFAEVLRRPGLSEYLQQEYRTTLAGPTTLWAILNSLQMGFRTLAIQKRSSEVWTVLGAVKTEFGKYSDVLDKVMKKLDETRNTMESAKTRTRAIERKLRQVQELPDQQTGDALTLPEPVEADPIDES
ncbi:MAG: DNA recombination protein RmuC [Phycisphaerales bacterium]|nr:DNA recombination protein RmuC [Phycisphaerales bacterium]